MGGTGRCSNSIPQMYCGVSRSICRYRTGATIKLTIAQTDTHVPEIVTDNPQARYLYYGMSKSGKSLNYTHTKNPLAGPRWDEAVMAAEGDAMAADLARYMRRMLK